MFFLSHWVCMAAARTVWFSFHLDCHKSAVSLSLKCFSDSDSCPNVRDWKPASVPPPAESMSSPTNTPLSPAISFILLSFVWFYIFLSTGHVLQSALSWCSACTSVLEGVFLMYPEKDVLHVHLLLCHLVLSHVWLWPFRALWTVAHQAPLSTGFCRQRYWSGLPFPSPGDLPNPRIKPRVSCIFGRFFTIWATREGLVSKNCRALRMVVYVRLFFCGNNYQHYYEHICFPLVIEKLFLLLRTFLFLGVCAMSLHSCPILCNSMDYSPPGSSVHGIFQARLLEWGCHSLQGILPPQWSNLHLLTSLALEDEFFTTSTT